MKLRLLLLALFGLSAFITRAQYLPDVLGDDYTRRTFSMPADEEGAVTCTLIKKGEPQADRRTILYIHGYNDYFFQKHLGDSLSAEGFNFYALDLRKYGRSLLSHQTPFYCRSLTDYFADIDTALFTLRAEGNRHITLMAHSTGGLIAPYYLNSKKGELPVEGLVLNSPFLDWNESWFMENVVIPVVAFVGKFFPRLTVQGYGLPYYAYSLLENFRGEWNYNTDWKKNNGYPKTAGWIRAIHQAQQTVQSKSKLECPILVLSSTQSYTETDAWHDEYQTSDIVLDVSDIQHFGQKLGNRVSLERIPNGMHDLMLSLKTARDTTYHCMLHWIKGL